MLQIIWGEDWQANRAALLAALCQSGDGQRIWIVPEQASFAAEQQLCRKGGSGICRHAQVLSFTRLANRVFAASGGVARQTLDQGGRVLAMAQALEQVRSRLKRYAAGSRRAALLPELLAAVDEWKSYGVTASDLRRAAGQTEGLLAGKLEELSLILESYDTVCAAGQQDPRDRLAYLSKRLGQTDFARDKAFYLDGFSDFTGVELEILQQLLRSGASVTLCLCCDGLERGLPVFDTARETARAMLRAAAQAGQRVFVRQVAPARNDEILFAARHLFAPGGAAWGGKASCVHLRRFDGPFAQAQAVAATILQLLRQGFRYREIAVAAADDPAGRTVLQTVLRQYGIPAYFAGQRPLLQEPVFEMVLAALDAATGGLEREDVLRWLKSGLAGVARADVDLLENYALVWNISGSRWASDWTAHPAGYDAAWDDDARAQLAQLNELRARALAPLLRLRRALESAAAAGPMVQAFYAFLEEIGLDGQLEQQAQAQYDAGQLQASQQTAQLHEILIGALEQMYSLLAATPVEAAQFAQLLQVLLQQYHVASIPAALDCVVCGGIGDLRFHTPRALLLTGCDEGVLPQYAAPTGVFSDQERAQLQALGIALAPDSWRTLSRALAVLHQLLLGCGAQLFWFCATEQPSYLQLRMERLFPTRLAAYEALQYPPEFSDPALLAASAVLPEGGPAVQAAALLDDATVNDRMAVLRQRAAYTPGLLQRATVTGLYGQKLYLSASQIQTFAGCRQAHFLRYGIKARPRARAEFNAPVYGTFVHAVLEQTVRQVQAQGGFASVPPEAVEAIARAQMDTCAAALRPGPEVETPRFTYLFQRNYTEILTVIRELDGELRQSRFEPVRFELPFRPGTPMGPVEIQGKSGAALLTGAVDRVDLLHTPQGDYVRVVDYKTGHRDFDYTDLLTGLGLQMLLYLFALEENGTREFGGPVKPAGVLYFPARCNLLTLPQPPSPDALAAVRQKDLRRQGLLLDDEALLQAMEPAEGTPRYLPYSVKKDGRSGDLASPAQLALLRQHVRRLLAGMTDELFAGKITANPYSRGATGACTYCDYAPICHPDPSQLRRLQATGAAEFWARLAKEEEEHGKV